VQLKFTHSFIYRRFTVQMKIKNNFSYLFLFLCFSGIALSQNYNDQIYVFRTDSIFQNIETNVGLKLSADGKSIMLQENATDGYIILNPQHSQSPFNEGLPSWNGSAPNSNGGFKVQMRFPYGSGWSPWLTVGFWKANIWSSYGSTSYSGGFIDYDNVKLSSYQSTWQFKIIMTRTSVQQTSPSLHKLSFFISDSRTTSSLNINQIINDNPAQIFISTDFIYQYGVDPQIGGSICSPTSVAMILRSYNVSVNPLQFAQDTYDPHFNMFGIWPRVVQNASEYGLDGAVTRYRTWSEAREVLANGGRISMSVGLPLYSGHLIMLAGFTNDGRPIVHDPAKSNGYSYIFNKSDLSHSWFDKGGVAYTFYPADSVAVSVENQNEISSLPNDFRLYQNYPNPFNPSTKIRWQSPVDSWQTLKVFDIAGNEVATLVDEYKPAGSYEVEFSQAIGNRQLASGVYFYRLQAGDYAETKSMLFLK
jgi:hypothetical protein